MRHTILRFITRHYGRRLRKYLKFNFPQMEKSICQEYPIRFARCMSEVDMGDNSGCFVSYLNIFSGLAAYALMRESGLSEAEGIAAYDEMCSTLRELSRILYRFADLLPNGYQLVVNSLLEDMTGAKAVCWDTELVENSDRMLTYKIHRCLYFDTCAAHGYPEFTRVFCTHDWYSLGTLRRHAKFVRYSTLGEGGDCCHDSIVRITRGNAL